MPNKVLDFNRFVMLFEGGAAIKSARRIREDEFPKTLESIKSILFPILNIDPTKSNDQYIIIGSIGKKKNPDDTSGDLDLGIDSSWFAREHNIGVKDVASFINEVLNTKKLSEKLGFDPEINYLKGLNIVSIGWPVEGDQSKGMVQLDLIPISSMEWAEFIYYSPNYKIDESKYKSAHRNWLLAAILSERRQVLDSDENGDVMDYDTPVLILSDGLFWHTKSYKGKLKARLKNAKKIEGSERFVTRNPHEFVKFALGREYDVNDVKTFEDLLRIIESDDFDLHDRLSAIIEKFKEYLTRANLEIPSEINQLS
jgi:hypothetical protein